jgi:hypothetical protein
VEQPGPYELNELDVIWNTAGELGAAGDAPEETPPGIVHLSHLLRVYNSSMGGGLGFAFEVNEGFRIRRAIDALSYFGLPELAELFEDLLDHVPDFDYIGNAEHRYDTLVGNGDIIDERFRAKAAEAPGDFGMTRATQQ